MDPLEMFKEILTQRAAANAQKAQAHAEVARGISERQLFEQGRAKEMADAAVRQAPYDLHHGKVYQTGGSQDAEDADAFRRKVNLTDSQVDRPVAANQLRNMTPYDAADIFGSRFNAEIGRQHDDRLAAQDARDNAGELENLRAENPGKFVVPPGMSGIGEGGQPPEDYQKLVSKERRTTIDPTEANYGHLVDLRDKNLGTSGDAQNQHLFYRALANQAGDPYTLSSQLAGMQAAERKRTLGMWDPSMMTGI